MPADKPQSEMTPFEAALAAIAPAPAQFDRDALMYAAGRRSIRGLRIWPIAAGTFALISLALAVRMTTVEPRVVEKIIVVREPAAASTVDRSANTTDSTGAVETMSDSDLDAVPFASPTIDLVRERIGRNDKSETFPQSKSPSNWTAPPTPPLENDLGLPPGSLREFQPRSPSFILSISGIQP
jgi:hypothetical protein